MVLSGEAPPPKTVGPLIMVVVEDWFVLVIQQ